MQSPHIKHYLLPMFAVLLNVPLNYIQLQVLQFPYRQQLMMTILAKD